MKKKLMVLSLFVLGMVMILGASHVFADEVTIISISVDAGENAEKDSEDRVILTTLYGSSFTKENIALVGKVEKDGVETDGVKLGAPDGLETISGEPLLSVDTLTLGSHIIQATYGDKKVALCVYVIPRKLTGLKLVVDKCTTNSVEIGWDAMEEAKGYDVFESDTLDGTYTKKYSSADPFTRYTYSDMKPGQKKYIKVRTKGVGDDKYSGEFSDPILITPKPAKVTSLVWGKSYKTKAEISWKKVEGADGYLVSYKLKNSSAIKLAADVKTETAVITGLTSGNDYEVMVCAYALNSSYTGEDSDKLLIGTNPSSPGLPMYVGGDARLKIQWSTISGASSYRVYLSTSSAGTYNLITTRGASDSKKLLVTGLVNNQKYYIKVQSVRAVNERELTSDSAIKTVSVKAVPGTSTGAKLFSNYQRFKKSAAYKKYTTFKKNVVYGKSFVVPGMKTTNVAGFQSTRMIPQSICFAGKYLLISAYDYTNINESVIYIMDKSTRKYISTMVLPHKGHVGGIAYDGSNLWIAYGSSLQSIKYSTIARAANKKVKYTNITSFASVCATKEQVSYVTYYKGRIWAGAYSQYSKKYLYGYTIKNKSGKAGLTSTCKILLPNRTQGLAMTSDGYLLVSRSCQTKKGKSGFVSTMETYKPSWGKYKGTIKIGAIKKKVSMPPMNEGIAIDGKYSFVIYESVGFSECQARLDRITAFKTTSLLPKKTKKKK